MVFFIDALNYRVKIKTQKQSLKVNKINEPGLILENDFNQYLCLGAEVAKEFFFNFIEECSDLSVKQKFSFAAIKFKYSKSTCT